LVVWAYNVRMYKALVRGGLPHRFLTDGAIDMGVYFDTATGAVKSADVTYDDEGRLIPLSRRFDLSSDDVRR